MSVAHEATVARHCGIRVIAISLITNICSDNYNSAEDINNDHVISVGITRAKQLSKLIGATISRLKNLV